MIRNHKDLIVWQEGMRLALDVYRIPRGSRLMRDSD